MIKFGRVDELEKALAMKDLVIKTLKTRLNNEKSINDGNIDYFEKEIERLSKENQQLRITNREAAENFAGEMKKCSLDIERYKSNYEYLKTEYENLETECENLKKWIIDKQLEELTYDDKPVKVLSMSGYNDGYYWDMNSVVEYEGAQYTICDAGSGSYYILPVTIVTKGELNRLYGEKQMDVYELDVDDIDFILGGITQGLGLFFESGAENSVQTYADEDNWEHYIVLDEGEPMLCEKFWKNKEE